ncbi:MAG: M20/M25/M40 family metallo-hydrolase [Oscillospiraceae bacterium]|nr:M20/M25/M40 family metallo-hydrolase [Oscillospiraceae bacterium]MBR4928567.1 M20/M25/M40 family metallo-hydrolase [Oscillospiraceae bacterium]MBR5071443.1 M20/M25/M40 family metallo-hydrolase [Oscillospiraceae bacterium]
MDKNRAWDLLKEMSFIRVAGTKEDLKTAKLLKAHCDEAGVSAVIEDFEIENSVISEATFEVLEPEYCSYPVIGIGKTPNTKKDGAVGGFKYIENGLEANFTDIKDKVVLVQGMVRPDAMKKLADKGALGYIMIGGDFYEEESIKHELRPSDAFGKDNPLPGLKMHIDDAEKLVRSNPTKVRMVLKNRKKKATAHNVIATIEGTDLKDEVIIFSAHCDSVPYSTGSWDNATGSVTVMELMHYFSKNRPRRTMKFLWCGAEEIGLVGSRKYCEAHKDELEKVIFNINFDMTGVTLGYEHVCCSCSEETMHAIQYLANVENYPLDIELGMYSSDSSSFAGAGVPACTFARLNPRGGAQIHNHHDTMEHLDPDSFMITANFVAKFASQIANSTVNPIPRKFADKVKKALEERKRFMPDEEKEDKKPGGKKGGKIEEKPAKKDDKKAEKE